MNRGQPDNKSKKKSRQILQFHKVNGEENHNCSSGDAALASYLLGAPVSPISIQSYMRRQLTNGKQCGGANNSAGAASTGNQTIKHLTEATIRWKIVHYWEFLVGIHEWMIQIQLKLF